MNWLGWLGKGVDARRRLVWLLVALVVILAAALSGPFARIYYPEVGSRGLEAAWAFASAHPGAVNSALDRAIRQVQRALANGAQDGYAHRRLDQVWLLLGSNDRAVEAAIVNCLKVADGHATAGGGNEALHILNDRVLRLDPINLPALCRTVRMYQGMSEQPAKEFAEPMGERLRNLSSKEITLPTEPRLMAYVEQAVRALVEEGRWTQEKASTVLTR